MTHLEKGETNKGFKLSALTPWEGVFPSDDNTSTVHVCTVLTDMVYRLI